MISANLDIIKQRIRRACDRSGRNPEEITLVAVSKTFSAEDIQRAVRAGVHDIGENYVQELLQKRERLMPENIQWHFIGHLQSNKVKYIADWISLIQTVDSAMLAREINKRAAGTDRSIEVLLEVNTTGESSKFGVRPDQTKALVQSLAEYEHLQIGGLMTIGPFLPDPEGSRPMFRQLRKLRDEIAQLGLANVSMRHLSMGMTGDFEVAIEEGATIIRLGTAIFGSRKKSS